MFKEMQERLNELKDRINPKPNLLTIELKDVNSVPVVKYKGVVIDQKKSVWLNWVGSNNNEANELDLTIEANGSDDIAETISLCNSGD